MDALLVLAAFLLGLVGFVVGMAGVAIWVLRPVDRAASAHRHPPQFTLADFLCLFFLIQLSMTLGHSLATWEESQIVWVIDGYGWIAAGLLWWFGVQNLYRAGVHNLWHRTIFLAIVLPITLVGAVAAPVLPIMILVSVAKEGSSPSDLYLLTAAVGLAFAVYGCGRFTRYVVSRATPAPVSSEG